MKNKLKIPQNLVSQLQIQLNIPLFTITEYLPNSKFLYLSQIAAETHQCFPCLYKRLQNTVTKHLKYMHQQSP